MANEKTKDFLTLLKKKESDEAFREKVANTKSEEEKLRVFADMAKEMGYDISVSDIKEALTAEDAKRKARTDAASEDMMALDDSELEDAAGGFFGFIPGISKKRYHECIKDYTDDDCNLTDACDWSFNVYFDCEGTYHDYDSVYHCVVNYGCKYFQIKNVPT